MGEYEAQRMLVRLLSRIKPKDVVKGLRPRELTYLCEICAVINDLGLCDDVFDDDNDEEEEEE